MYRVPVSMLAPSPRVTTVRALSVAIVCYAAVGYTLFLSVADNALSKLGYLPLAPTVSTLLFLLPFVATVLIADAMHRNLLRTVVAVLRSNLGVVVPFMLIAFLSLLFSLHPDAYWEEKGKWIFLLSYSFLIFVCGMLPPLFSPLRRRFHLFAALALLALVGSIVADVNVPGTFSVEPNRAAGFPSNSNWGALAVVMLCAAALHYDPQRSSGRDFFLLGAAGFAVFATLSRSGLLNFAVLVVYYFYRVIVVERGSLKGVAKLAFVGIFGVSLIGTFVPELVANSALFRSSNASGRLFSFLEGKVVDDGSSAGRMNAVKYALAIIEDAPLLGRGTGHTRTLPEKPHNQYLNQWVNNGLLGLLAYMGLLAGALFTFSKRNYPQGVALILVTFVGSFFSHNILEQRTFLLLLGSFLTLSLINERRSSGENEGERSLTWAEGRT